MCILPSVVVRLATCRYSVGVGSRGGGGGGSSGGPCNHDIIMMATGAADGNYDYDKMSPYWILCSHWTKRMSGMVYTCIELRVSKLSNH